MGYQRGIAGVNTGFGVCSIILGGRTGRIAECKVGIGNNRDIRGRAGSVAGVILVEELVLWAWICAIDEFGGWVSGNLRGGDVAVIEAGVVGRKVL